MNNGRRAAIAVGAVLVLGCAASVWPKASSHPSRVPCQRAEPWMVDGLPGVGAHTRAAMTEAVRAGRFVDLPPAARARAVALFAAPDAR